MCHDLSIDASTEVKCVMWPSQYMPKARLKRTRRSQSRKHRRTWGGQRVLGGQTCVSSTLWQDLEDLEDLPGSTVLLAGRTQMTSRMSRHCWMMAPRTTPRMMRRGTGQGNRDINRYHRLGTL